jgi:DNA modification methylase
MTQPIRADGIPVHCAFTRLIPTNLLRPNPANPNRHSKEQIALFAKIIEHLGWRSPIVVSLRSGLIVKGHGRLEVARHMQLKDVPIDEQAYIDEAAETQDMLADNRITELSERDEAEVANLLKSLAATGANMDATGYADKDVSRLLGILETQGKETESIPGPDQADILQLKWKVKLGDVWQAGDHRLICGDSGDPLVWKRLLRGDRGQLIHTDPPYGVDYQDSNGTTIQGDNLKQNALSAMIRRALVLGVEHTFHDAAVYIWHASSTRRDFEAAIDAAGLVERQYITWVKDSFVMGRADYHWQTEPCFYCEKAGHRAKYTGDRAQSTVWRLNMTPNDGTATAIANGLHITDGGTGQLFIRASKPKSQKARHIRLAPGETLAIADRALTTAWEIARDDRKEYLHPTQKPAELATIPIVNNTSTGDIVIDCFAGSHSTLIAAEIMHRRARTIDLEPKWVAVGLERWARLTNREPVLLP